MSLGQKQLPAKIARAKALLEKLTPAEREQALKVSGKMADRAVQKRREAATDSAYQATQKAISNAKNGKLGSGASEAG